MRKGIFGFLGAAALFAFAGSAFAQSGVCPNNALGHASSPITASTYTIGQTDQCKLKVFNSSSAVAVGIPAPGTAGGFFPNFFVQTFNQGAGAVTITPSKNNAATTPTINGKTTLVLRTGQGADISVGADGNWYANTTSASTSAPCTASGSTPQTCNGLRGVVTTGTLTTGTNANAAAYTISNSSVTAASVVQCTVDAYSGTVGTNGTPVITQCVPGSSSIVVNIRNVDGTNALNGTVGIGFLVAN